ncbi:hypothetical protein AVEN_194069-1 [Araneus ventricosus]|uniref:Uncharacterized protein n=1 Tax=Araneus ventricosus TaxID=182803 RepID=A0A4Y2LLL5_ARAVE|nr:hypothetical protein AVEN_194069-1 [Araneus ventricosus]
MRKEKVELEEAKANRVFNKNKNGDKTKKKKSPEIKEKTYFEFLSKTQFLQQVRQIMRGQIAQTANTHMMKIGPSVDCKEWWNEKCSSYEGSEHLYETTAKFSGCVILDSFHVR